jgi:hypothetical protein
MPRGLGNRDQKPDQYRLRQGHALNAGLEQVRGRAVWENFHEKRNTASTGSYRPDHRQNSVTVAASADAGYKS